MASIESEYHSSITPRETFQRGSSYRASAASQSGRSIKIVSEMGASSVAGISAAMGHEAAASIKDSRDREKKEMQDLNDRLGAFIDKVRFLEAQNRKLVEDLEALRGTWGKNTAGIKAQYATELGEVRRLIDDAGRDKGALEIQLARLQNDIDEMRNKYEIAQSLQNRDKDLVDQYTNNLNDATNEIEQLQRRLQMLQTDHNRYDKDNQKLEVELAEVKDNLDKETVGRVAFQNQAQTLLEEIEFQRRIHDQEIKELEALMAKDTPQTTKDYFRNELALAIGDIRIEYDNIALQKKTDMESWYKLKVQEVSNSAQGEAMGNAYRDEAKRVRDQLENTRDKLGELDDKNAMLEKQVQELTYQLSDDQRQYESALNDRDLQIRRMREEVHSLMMELQALMDTKQSLDAEIAIYRRMLEGEESRSGLRTLVENVVSKHAMERREEGVAAGEVSQKMSFQRSAKGILTIADVSAEGKFITVENTSRSRAENIEGWKLKRKVDGKREYTFVFPKGTTVDAGKSVKIWAKNAGGTLAPPESLIFEDSNTWGVGKNIQTLLINKEGEERASHIQRSMEAVVEAKK
jgi:intermediate filament protein if